MHLLPGQESATSRQGTKLRFKRLRASSHPTLRQSCIGSSYCSCSARKDHCSSIRYLTNFPIRFLLVLLLMLLSHCSFFSCSFPPALLPIPLARPRPLELRRGAPPEFLRGPDRPTRLAWGFGKARAWTSFRAPGSIGLGDGAASGPFCQHIRRVRQPPCHFNLHATWAPKRSSFRRASFAVSSAQAEENRPDRRFS